MIRVRLSPEDLDTLSQRADGEPLSTYIRQVALGREKGKRIPSANREIAGQLARIGNNLNQLVRLAHTGRFFPVHYETVMKELYELLAKTQRQMLEDPR